MKNYLMLLPFIFSFAHSNFCSAQRKYLVGSFWGFPAVSGIVYSNLGFEYQAGNNADAWQLSINLSSGALATDIGTTNRKWVTLDKFRSFKKSFHENYSLFYSLFIEAGHRKITGGMWRQINDTSLNKKESFEINPGIGLGTNIKLFKKIHLQIIAAPKVIIAFHKDKYFDLLNKNYFYKKFTDSGIGFRLAANFCLRL